MLVKYLLELNFLFLQIISFLVDLTIPEGDGSVTYEQMMSFIDQILRETDYFKDTVISVQSSESLPPTAQRNQRPPPRRK
jgi:hypothetical protein